MSRPTSFDGVTEKFNSYETSVRGSVRYEMTREQIEPFIGEAESVIDICGGSGPDTFWLASQDCDVTLVEPSSEQLELARDRFKVLTPEQQARISIVQSSFQDYEISQQFDAGFSHGVAMYLDDPEAHWRKALQCIKRGGVLTILEKGYGATAQRLAAKRDVEGLKHLSETGKTVNNMGFEVMTFTLEEIVENITALGARVLHTAGIRQISDAINEPRWEFGEGKLQCVLDAERELAEDPSTMGMAQMLLVVAQRR